MYEGSARECKRAPNGLLGLLKLETLSQFLYRFVIVFAIAFVVAYR